MGDDLILVSVSSERYLVSGFLGSAQSHLLRLFQCAPCPTRLLFAQHLSYASGDLMVDASFMQTLWTMTPVMSGCELAEGLCFSSLNDGPIHAGLAVTLSASRVSDWRLRVEAFPRTHGRVSGHSSR